LTGGRIEEAGATDSHAGRAKKGEGILGSEPALVLVHGAFHGGWCWSRVVPLLEDRGIGCSAIDLHRGGLDEDRTVVQDEVDRLAGAGHRVSVIGHSLGCAPLVLLDPGRLEHVIFFAGPVAGSGLPDARAAILPAFFEAARFDEEKTMHFDPAAAFELFYHDCDAETARMATARLCPNASYPIPEAPEPPIWTLVPSIYFVCEGDRVVAADYQRSLAREIGRSETFAGGHSPMLAQPEVFADAVARSILD